MLEAKLRDKYDALLVIPIARRLSRYPSMTPFKVTLLACLSGVLVIPALVFGMPIIAVILLVFSGYLDTLDGVLARLLNKSTELGGVLDIVCDRVVETAVIFGLFALDPASRGYLALGMLGSILVCITAFLVVGIFKQNESHKSFFYSHGLMERPEAFAFFIAMILLPKLFVLLASLFIFLVLLTSILHLVRYFGSVKN